MKFKKLISAFIAVATCFAPLSSTLNSNSRITAHAISLGDVNSDGTIDSSDASLILGIYADLSTGKTLAEVADQMNVADVNCDKTIDSTDASIILSYYAYVSIGGTYTLQEFMLNPPQPNISKTNTFIASNLSMEVPKSWKYEKYVKNSGNSPSISYYFFNGDFGFFLLESKLDTSNSDEQWFESFVKYLDSNNNYKDVKMYSSENIDYIKATRIGSPDVDTYNFIHDGWIYSFGVKNLQLEPDGEDTIINVLNSVVFDPTEIEIPCSNNFKGLSAEEKQYLIKSIMMFSCSFVHADSIVLNNCCETSINNTKAYIYDISYTSSANIETNNIFIFYPDTNTNIISNKSYNELTNEYTVTNYNAEVLNNAIRDYYEQFK